MTTTPRKRIRSFTSNPSPWQILVARRAEELGLSTRALADAISTPEKAIYNSTVWSWIRNVDGCPPASAYTAQVNADLARALGIQPAKLSAAYDASRARFGDVDGGEANKRLVHLRRVLSQSPAKSWTKTEMLTLIDEILNL